MLPSRLSPGTAPTASRAVLWGIVSAALAHVSYLALLISCDVMRLVPLGFVAHFPGQSMVVREVTSGSAAARAGLESGDHVVGANGQPIGGRMDWERVRMNLDPDAPLTLRLARGGQARTIAMPLERGDPASLPASRPALIGFRLAQVITLGLAILVAVRRATQPTALLGALLLASVATLSLAPPMRLGLFWRSLPSVVAATLWVPMAVSASLGPLLFAFCATFPTRTRSRLTLALLLTPAAAAIAWSVHAMYVITRPLSTAPTGLPDWAAGAFAVNVVYACGAIALLVARRRAAESPTDRRRIGVLSVGVAVGVTAGAATVGGYWRDPGADIFASTALTLLSLVFLAVPASFAYAILRHRLFDLPLILRQGVRYALARRMLNALIPALGALLIVDFIAHRDQPLVGMVQSRWWWYTLVGAGLIVARTSRERWLKSLDRRFFRERYDAQRLLKNIAEQISRATSFEAIAPIVASQASEALHPEFVDVLRHTPGTTAFTPVVSGGSDRLPEPLPSSFTVIGLLSVLGQPLALSLGDTAWVRHQLPADERSALSSRGIELLVPIVSQASGVKPVALLVLGPRRSEEPYNEEDLDLLGTIAHALGLLLDRPPTDGAPAGLAECESCGRCFDSTMGICADDSQRLTPVRGARVLNGRYRLERRLGRGGMGAVYAAVDEALERAVAVKLIREDLAASADLNARFRHEARAAAAFAHPNVVRVYDFGVDGDGRPFIVMELLEGETLRQRLARDGRIDRAEVLLILRGVCQAISAAHAHGLVHRDMKPENVFLQRNEGPVVPKVLDFGLAKAFGGWQHGRARGTDAGILVGTLEYMAPEQAAGDIVSPSWDIWALGVITHEMLTGYHPFRRQVTFDGDEDIPTGSDDRDALLPAEVSALLASALSSHQRQRPRDALDFMRAFEQVL